MTRRKYEAVVSFSGTISIEIESCGNDDADYDIACDTAEDMPTDVLISAVRGSATFETSVESVYEPKKVTTKANEWDELDALSFTESPATPQKLGITRKPKEPK